MEDGGPSGQAPRLNPPLLEQQVIILNSEIEITDIFQRKERPFLRQGERPLDCLKFPKLSRQPVQSISTKVPEEFVKRGGLMPRRGSPPTHTGTHSSLKVDLEFILLRDARVLQVYVCMCVCHRCVHVFSSCPPFSHPIPTRSSV